MALQMQHYRINLQNYLNFYEFKDNFVRAIKTLPLKRN
jgi:hypothetical protein